LGNQSSSQWAARRIEAFRRRAQSVRRLVFWAEIRCSVRILLYRQF